MAALSKYWGLLNGYKTQSGFVAAGLLWAIEQVGLVSDGTLASCTPLFLAWIGAAGAAKFQRLVAK